MNLNGLARSLNLAGLIDEEHARKALDIAKAENSTFVAVAVKNGYVDALQVANLASNEFGLPLLDLAAFDTELLIKDIVSNDLIEKHRVLPIFKRGNRLFLAQSDPSNITAIDEIKFNTGMNVEPVIVEENKLAILVEKFISAVEKQYEAQFSLDTNSSSGILSLTSESLASEWSINGFLKLVLRVF